MQNKLTNLALKCIDIYKDYKTTLNNISEELELQNKVASLSNCAVADALTHTIRNIAYSGIEPNHETICKYLKQAIEDLTSGMNATEMLWKYDTILYCLQHGYELERYNMFLKEIHWYEQCDKNKGDKCEHSRCQYSVLTLGNGFYCFTCGRYNK